MMLGIVFFDGAPMDLHTLQTFRVAARTLSFTQTAAALGYAQSSVTAQMKALEESLGVPLFDRLGNRLQLTEPGERLRSYADRLLALADEAKAAVRGDEPGGALTFSAPETVCTYLLPPLLKRFADAFPTVQLRFVPLPVREFKRSLMEGTVDAAFILEERFAPGNLRVEHLRDEPLAVVAHPAHPLARSVRVTAQDLIGEAVLLTELGCSYRNRFERSLIQAGAYPTSRMEFQSIEAIKKCVEARLGIAALPRVAIAAEVAAGRLVELAWKDRDLGVATQLAWSEGRWMSPALDAFVSMARAVIGERRSSAAPRRSRAQSARPPREQSHLLKPRAVTPAVFTARVRSSRDE
jgi:DNA-binding transcriptional LysR family regulator